MAIGRDELQRKIEEERARANREIEGIRRAANEKIARIQADSDEHRKRMEAQYADLERRQREARERMETEMVRSMERQKDEVRKKIARLEKETSEALRIQAEEMRSAWQKVYREMDARIRKIDARVEGMLEKERAHAMESLSKAKTAVSRTVNAEVMRRFGGFWLEHLQYMLRLAIDEYNAGNSLPADGQAMMTVAECARCEAEARDRNDRWEPYYRKVKRIWEDLRDRLSEMEKPDTSIEAAGLTITGTQLSVWNDGGWKAAADALEEIRARIDAPAPCSLEELAMAQITLRSFEEPIESAIENARLQVIRFLYLSRVMDEVVALVEEFNDGWEETLYETEMVTNRGRAVLAPGGVEGEEAISVEMHIDKKSGALRVTISDSSYDNAAERNRRLANICAELKGTLDGEHGPSVMLGEGFWFRNGDAVCVGFDGNIPGTRRYMPPAGTTDTTANGRAPAKGADESNNTKEVF